MRFSVMALIAQGALGQTWKKNSYCDYDQFVIDEYTSTDSNYNADTCFQWCVDLDKVEGSNYKSGDDMCCDFEEWQDGTFNCYLYAGGLTVSQDMNDYPDDTFNSNVFPHLMPAAAVSEEKASYMAVSAAALLVVTTLL